jgi:hypothetical protein
MPRLCERVWLVRGCSREWPAEVIVRSSVAGCWQVGCHTIPQVADSLPELPRSRSLRLSQDRAAEVA